jgi:hypothetical protein
MQKKKKSNRYVQQVSNSEVGNVATPLRKWTRITMRQMKGFLVCILNMGIIKEPTIASYWSTHCSQANPWFTNMFTMHHFFHFALSAA